MTGPGCATGIALILGFYGLALASAYFTVTRIVELIGAPQDWCAPCDCQAWRLIGAGDGNRTHAICLGSKSSAIELHPHDSDFIGQADAPADFYAQRRAQR